MRNSSRCRCAENGFDLEGIAPRSNSNTRIVFLANPNNPTGTVVTADEVNHFLRQHSRTCDRRARRGLLRIRRGLCGKRGIEYSHSLDYVREGRNVVVLRTFSKVHGLAGASGRIRHRSRVVDAAYLAAARNVLCFDSGAGCCVWLRSTTKLISEKRWKTIPRSGDGLFPPSQSWDIRSHHLGKFLVLRTGAGCSSFADSLQARGIAVRALDQWGAPQAIRITIGTPEQNAALLNALSKLKKR